MIFDNNEVKWKKTQLDISYIEPFAYSIATQNDFIPLN